MQNKEEDTSKAEEKSKSKSKRENEATSKPKKRKAHTIKDLDYEIEYDETVSTPERVIEYDDEDEDD